MKKLFFGSLVFILLITGATRCWPKHSPPDGWVLYQDASGTFQFYHPPEWEYSQTDTSYWGTIGTAFLGWRPGGGNGLYLFFIDSIGVIKAADTEAYLAQVIGAPLMEKGQWADWHPLGYQGYWGWGIKNQGYAFCQIVIRPDNTGFRMCMYTLPSEAEGIMEDIFLTFK